MSDIGVRAAPRDDALVLTDWAARTVDVVRWVLVGLLVLDVLLGLLTLPRPATLGELQRDLAAGRVQSVSIVAPTDLRSTHVLSGWLPGSDSNGTSVLWRVGDLGYRIAPLPGSSATDPRRDVVTEAVAATPDTVGRQLPLRWPGLAAVVLLALVLAIPVAPQPRRVTKWALFWLLLMPLNGGLLWLLLREAPWSPAARVLPVPAPHRFQPGDRRLTGGKAFIYLLLACFLGQAVSAALAQHTW